MVIECGAGKLRDALGLRRERKFAELVNGEKERVAQRCALMMESAIVVLPEKIVVSYLLT